MALWIIFSLTVVVALVSVAVPLFWRRAPVAAPNHDLEVYKDQIAEIERDARNGLIGAEEASAASAEISRRILAAQAGSAGAGDSASSTRSMAAMAVATVTVLVTVAVVYGSLGAPTLPDQPLAARMENLPTAQRVTKLVAQVEKHLAANPEDGKGWEVLAPVYFRFERYTDAVTAYRNTIRLLGSSAARQADLGEAVTAANGGIVSAAARQAFEQALGHDPAAVKPQFFLAIALTQDGDRAAAVAAWRKLLGQSTGDEGWAKVARTQLAALQRDGAPPGNQSAAVASANPGGATTDMSDDQRQMIVGMVTGLAERLKEDGGSVEEWRRLIRSYVVLGDQPAALAALANARSAYGEDAAALSQINELAARFKLDSSANTGE